MTLFHLFQKTPLLIVDWMNILFGEEKWDFLPEVAARSVIMFLLILFSLRILGKRSVTQLSVFELGVITGLGSAAGDPMFYKDVGLLPAILVFVIVIALYRLVTFLINHSQKIEKALEGEPVYLVEEGKFNCENFKNELIAYDEFFSQLRQKSVSHLGQVKLAIIETNGAISVYYYDDEEVQWGLPVLPHLCNEKQQHITKPGKYACTACGQVEEVKAAIENHECTGCKKTEWIAAINEKRIG